MSHDSLCAMLLMSLLHDTHKQRLPTHVWQAPSNLEEIIECDNKDNSEFMKVVLEVQSF